MQRYDWWWIISRPTGASRSAVGRTSGATCLFLWSFCAQDATGGVQRRAFLSDPTISMSSTLPPNMALGSTSGIVVEASWRGDFLKRGDFGSAQAFETRLSDSLEMYNTHQAHPYRWTYTGQPLVRATPFSRTRRQQRHGRAWFSARPQRFERVFYPPRPYKRAAA